MEEQNIEVNEGNEPSPEVTTPVESGNEPAPVQDKTEDLLSRVTKFVNEEKPENKSDDNIDEKVFNDAQFRDKIEAIEDEELKGYMKALRKSGVRGVNDKMSEIAEMRKELESFKSSQARSKFSYNSIEEMLNDPIFVQEASKYTNTPSESQDEEYIPESVKNDLLNVKKQLSDYKQQQAQAQILQEHNALRSKYANYNPERIDEIRKDLLEGKINANSEHLYKAFTHDENVKRAYEMGLHDGTNGVKEKFESVSIDGNTQQQSTNLRPEKNENDKSFIKRIISKNLSMVKR
jgi:hypothetical protein